MSRSSLTSACGPPVELPMINILGAIDEKDLSFAGPVGWLAVKLGFAVLAVPAEPLAGVVAGVEFRDFVFALA